MRIVIVAGPICSGKDHKAVSLINDGIVESHISIGDIVRRITSTSARIFNKDLDTAIIENLLEDLEGHYNRKMNVVVTGIRQISIIKAIERFIIEHKGQLYYQWLNEETSILKKRFEERHETKDNFITFEEAYKKDRELGLKDVQDYIAFKNTPH